ncbi:hypothetical protein [Nocardioides sp. LML1-1-1.1]|uniref:hypothetical protein n=1 Tax=Nocardioides sp. LML1-1-1.1 TaxID=3135248 RepID=UPI00341BA957
MSRRPTPADIFDWVEGRLSPERARAVAEHVATEPAAAATAEWFERFRKDAASLPLEQPPAELSQRLRDLFGAGTTQVSGPHWTTARLLYDTRDANVAGMRSADTLDTVHVAFESEAGRFVLEIRPAGQGAVDLIGLLLLDDPVDGVDLSLLEDGVVRRMVRAGSDGRFELREVPDSIDEMRFEAGPMQVSTPLRLRCP